VALLILAIETVMLDRNKFSNYEVYKSTLLLQNVTKAVLFQCRISILKVMKIFEYIYEKCSVPMTECESHTHTHIYIYIYIYIYLEGFFFSKQTSRGCLYRPA